MDDLTEILNALTNYILNERNSGYNEGLDAERKRCAAIVQAARHDEIDRDWRSIIHRIETGSPFPDPNEPEPT